MCEDLKAIVICNLEDVREGLIEIKRKMFLRNEGEKISQNKIDNQEEFSFNNGDNAVERRVDESG